MAINYTSLLGLAQPVTGTEAGAWGNITNTQITALLEEAVASTASLDVTSGDITLTNNVGVANQARRALLLVTGTPGTTRNIIAPSQSKVYVVLNNSNSTVVVKGAATTGVSIPTTARAVVAWNGTDFVSIAGSTPGSIGATTIGSNLVTLPNPGAITFPRFNADNTVSALSAADFRTAIGSGSGTVTSVSGTGTASGLTLSGTVTTSGNITLSGTVNSLAAGTYGISITGNAATANNVTGTVAVANGGTGQTSLTANNVVLGNGTSSVQFVAPGSNGNVLTSDGTTWISQAAPSGMVYPGAGVAVSTGSAWTTSLTAPSGTLVGTTDAQTLTSKRVNPRVISAATASALTPDVSAADQYVYTNLSESLTISAPIGTPLDGNKLTFRFKSTGASYALNWDSSFRAVGVILPTSTSVGNVIYVGAIYNSAETVWDVVAVAEQ